MHKLVLIFLISLPFNLMAQNQSSAELFDKGIASYKQQNYEEALGHFKSSLSLSENSVSALYNTGLTEYQLGQLGRASAYWKKIIALSPLNSEARRSLNLIKKKMPSLNPNHFWEKFRNNILTYFSLSFISIVFTLFFALGSTSLVKHFTRRYIALKNHLPLPNSSRTSMLFIVCFLIFSILFFSKLYDHSMPRAVVIKDVSSLFISPSEEDIKISELSQGAEVIIKNKNEDWFQIKTSGGNHGWILKSDLFLVSGAAIR